MTRFLKKVTLAILAAIGYLSAAVSAQAAGWVDVTDVTFDTAGLATVAGGILVVIAGYFVYSMIKRAMSAR